MFLLWAAATERDVDTVPIKVGKNAGKHPAIASLYRPSPKPMERFARQVLDGDRVPDDLAWQAENGSDDVMVRLLAQTRDGNAE